MTRRWTKLLTPILLLTTLLPCIVEAATAIGYGVAPYPKFKAYRPGTSTPLAGGKLYTCQPGTTCPGAYPLTTYTDAVGTSPNSNPITLDSNGEADVWLTSYTKMALYDSKGVLVWSVDNVPPAGWTRLPSGATEVLLSAYPTFNIAVAAVGASPNVTLVCDTSSNVTTHVTVTPWVKVTPACKLSGAYTVTFQNLMDPGDMTWLDPSTNITYSKPNPIWWGAVAGADNTTYIQKAFNALPSSSSANYEITIPNSLISTTIVNTRDNVTVKFTGDQTFSSSFVKLSTGTEHGAYNVMYATTGNNTTFEGMVGKQGSYTHGTIFIWFGNYPSTLTKGLVRKGKFYNQLYEVGNNLPVVQVRTSTEDVGIVDTYFENCSAAYVFQGNGGYARDNWSYNNDSNGGHDAHFSINGGSKNRISGDTFTRSSGSPTSGSIVDIQATTDFIVESVKLYGLKAGTGIYAYNSSGPATRGKIINPVISGGGFTSTSPWNMIKLEDVSGIDIINPVLYNPSTGAAGTGSVGIYMTPQYNTVRGGKFDLNDSAITAAIYLAPKISAAGHVAIENNYINTPNRGVWIDGHVYDANLLITEGGNTFRGGGTATCVSVTVTDTSVNFIAYTDNYMNCLVTNTTPALFRPMYYGNAGAYPYNLTPNGKVYYAAEYPTYPNYAGIADHVGDMIWQSTPVAGQPMGWRCTAAGSPGTWRSIGALP